MQQGSRQDRARHCPADDAQGRAAGTQCAHYGQDTVLPTIDAQVLLEFERLLDAAGGAEVHARGVPFRLPF